MKKVKAIEQFLVRLLAGIIDMPVALTLVSLIPIVVMFTCFIYRQLVQWIQATDETLFASGDLFFKH